MGYERKPYFSHSQLNMLTKCGQQWYFRYIEGLRVPPNVKMIVGRAVDASVNTDLTAKIATGELLPADAVADASRDGFEYSWQKEGVELSEEEMEVGIKATKGAAIDACIALSGLHHDVLAPAIKPEHVQRRFSIVLDGYDTSLVGVIDIDEGAVVRDTKTTRKRPTVDDFAQDTQATTYALAKKVLDGEAPKQIAFDFLIDRSANKRDKEPKHLTIGTTRSDADFKRLLNRVERGLKAIESGLFLPAPPGAWWCSPGWCGYWNRCPWVNRGAQVSVVEVAG